MKRGRGGAPVPGDRTQELTQQACREQETPGSDGVIPRSPGGQRGWRLNYPPPPPPRWGGFIVFVLIQETFLSFPWRGIWAFEPRTDAHWFSVKHTGQSRDWLLSCCCFLLHIIHFWCQHQVKSYGINDGYFEPPPHRILCGDVESASEAEGHWEAQLRQLKKDY